VCVCFRANKLGAQRPFISATTRITHFSPLAMLSKQCHFQRKTMKREVWRTFVYRPSFYDRRDQQVEHNPKTMIETFYPRRLTICLSPQSHAKKPHPSPSHQIGSTDSPAEPLVLCAAACNGHFFYISLRPWNSSLSAKSVVYQQFCKRQEGRGTQRHALCVK
jgi:hypothetical protein